MVGGLFLYGYAYHIKATGRSRQYIIYGTWYCTAVQLYGYRMATCTAAVWLVHGCTVWLLYASAADPCMQRWLAGLVTVCAATSRDP